MLIIKFVLYKVVVKVGLIVNNHGIKLYLQSLNNVISLYAKVSLLNADILVFNYVDLLMTFDVTSQTLAIVLMYV